MKKYTFILFAFALFFQSCNKDDQFSTEIEEQISEQIIDPESDGTQLKGKVFDDPYITELIPQPVLDKLQAGEELTVEEQINIDKVSFDHITYNGQSYTVDEAYTDANLMDVYFGENTITFITDRDIYLFDTEEEMEVFREQIINNRSNSRLRFKARFWEHTDYSGSSIYFQADPSPIHRLGFLLPSNWQNRVSSVKIWDAEQIHYSTVGTRVLYEMVANEGRTITYPISSSTNTIHFKNLFNLFPWEDPWQWNANYNDRMIAFSIHVAGDFIPGGGNNIFSLGGLVSFFVDQGLTALQNALGDVLFGSGTENGSVVETPSNLILIQPIGHDDWRASIGTRSYNDSGIYVEDNGGQAESWVVTNIVHDGSLRPVYRLSNIKTKKVLDQCGNCPAHDPKVLQWGYNGGHNQHWVFVKHNRWWWALPEYNIVNVRTGDYLTRSNTTSRLYAKPRNGSNDRNQRWYVHTLP